MQLCKTPPAKFVGGVILLDMNYELDVIFLY